MLIIRRGGHRLGGKNPSAKTVVIDSIVYETKSETIRTLGISGEKLNKWIKLGTCVVLDKNTFPLRGK